jgi:hypothetical protein
MNVVPFTIAALLSRAMQFAMVGFAVAAFGPKVLLWTERFERQAWISGSLLVAAALLYFIVKRF